MAGKLPSGIYFEPKKKQFDIEIKNNKIEPKIRANLKYSSKQNFRRYKTLVEPKLRNGILVNDETDNINNKLLEYFGIKTKEVKDEELLAEGADVYTSPSPYIAPPEEERIKIPYGKIAEKEARRVARLAERAGTRAEIAGARAEARAKAREEEAKPPADETEYDTYLRSFYEIPPATTAKTATPATATPAKEDIEKMTTMTMLMDLLSGSSSKAKTSTEEPITSLISDASSRDFEDLTGAISTPKPSEIEAKRLSALSTELRKTGKLDDAFDFEEEIAKLEKRMEAEESGIKLSDEAKTDLKEKSILSRELFYDTPSRAKKVKEIKENVKESRAKGEETMDDKSKAILELQAVARRKLSKEQLRKEKLKNILETYEDDEPTVGSILTTSDITEGITFRRGSKGRGRPPLETMEGGRTLDLSLISDD